eukprot:NODE_32_length_37098_cov_1.132760.p28 type:complete len:129 gc:universal NODE_32_length_37098_cov_1.132760:21902-22288(+)
MFLLALHMTISRLKPLLMNLNTIPTTNEPNIPYESERTLTRTSSEDISKNRLKSSKFYKLKTFLFKRKKSIDNLQSDDARTPVNSTESFEVPVTCFCLECPRCIKRLDLIRNEPVNDEELNFITEYVK